MFGHLFFYEAPWTQKLNRKKAPGLILFVWNFRKNSLKHFGFMLNKLIFWGKEPFYIVKIR